MSVEGMRFGSLEVKEFLNWEHGPHVLCRCDCGAEGVIVSSQEIADRRVDACIVCRRMRGRSPEDLRRLRELEVAAFLGGIDSSRERRMEEMIERLRAARSNVTA